MYLTSEYQTVPQLGYIHPRAHGLVFIGSPVSACIGHTIPGWARDGSEPSSSPPKHSASSTGIALRRSDPQHSMPFRRRQFEER